VVVVVGQVLGRVLPLVVVIAVAAATYRKAAVVVMMVVVVMVMGIKRFDHKTKVKARSER